MSSFKNISPANFMNLCWAFICCVVETAITNLNYNGVFQSGINRKDDPFNFAKCANKAGSTVLIVTIPYRCEHDVLPMKTKCISFVGRKSLSVTIWNGCLKWNLKNFVSGDLADRVRVSDAEEATLSNLLLDNKWFRLEKSSIGDIGNISLHFISIPFMIRK